MKFFLHSGAIGEHWSRELNSVQKWLLVALLIGAMYPASAQVTPGPNQLSQELVSARIQTLREAGSEDDTRKFGLKHCVFYSIND